MATQVTRQKTSSLMGRIADMIDRIVPPQTRREFFNTCSTLTNERPYLASFLAVQIALSALPFLLFAAFALGTVVLAAVAALAFCIFWIGAALLVFIPTLFTAIFAGIFFWIWAAGTYAFCSFAYRNIYPQVEQHMPDRSTVRSIRSNVEHTASRGAQSLQNGAQALSDKAHSVTDRAKSFANRDLAPGVPEVVKDSINQAQPEESSGREGYRNGNLNDTDATTKSYPGIDDYQATARQYVPGEMKY